MFCDKKCVILQTGWLPGALIGLGATVFMMHISVYGILMPNRENNKRNEKKWMKTCAKIFDTRLGIKNPSLLQKKK